MAERRMFAKKIIDSDAFLDMPLSAQALYFHLSMRADDDGFVDNPKKIMRMINSPTDDIKILITKNFIIPFDSGIVVIKHWKIHNYIQKDRYHETIYLKEKQSLKLLETKEYSGVDTECIQHVSNMDTQVRLGKVRLGKVRLGKASEEKEVEIEKDPPPASSGTIVPSEASPPNKGGNPSSLDRQRSLNKEGESVEQGESLPNKGKTRKGLPLKNVCRDENLSPVWLTEKEYNKLRNLFGRRMLEDSIESLAAYITSRGKRYKNHYAALRNWLKRETEKQPLSPEDEFIANLPPAGNYDL